MFIVLQVFFTFLAKIWRTHFGGIKCFLASNKIFGGERYLRDLKFNVQNFPLLIHGMGLGENAGRGCRPAGDYGCSEKLKAICSARVSRVFF